MGQRMRPSERHQQPATDCGAKPISQAGDLKQSALTVETRWRRLPPTRLDLGSASAGAITRLVELNMTSESLGGQPTRSDICRARELKWRNAPPGFSLEMAETFMGKLRDGKCIKQLTSGTTSIDYIASFARFVKQCELNPQWGEEARRLSMINGNRHKSENHAKRIALMCQAGLHSMTGDNVKIQGPAGGHRRYCAACRRATDLRARTMTVEEIVAVKAALLKGASIGQITQGRPVGGGATNVSLVLVRPKLLKRYRQENPEFDHLVTNRFEGSRLLGQRLRYQRRRSAEKRDQANDYYQIRSMLPATFPDKDDVVSAIFEDDRQPEA